MAIRVEKIFRVEVETSLNITNNCVPKAILTLTGKEVRALHKTLDKILTHNTDIEVSEDNQDA